MQEEQTKRKELRKTLKKKVLNRVLSPDFNDNVHAIVAQNAMMSRMRDMGSIFGHFVSRMSRIAVS